MPHDAFSEREASPCSAALPQAADTPSLYGPAPNCGIGSDMLCRLRPVPRAGAMFFLVALFAAGTCKQNDPAESTPQEVAGKDASAETAEGPAHAGDAGAPSPEAEAPEAESTPEITSPFLWEVEGSEGEPEGYLFGTMHMGVDAEEALPDIVWERLDAAETFVMEADLTDMSMASKLLRQDGTTLRQEIGEEAWNKLVSIVGKMQARGLDQMKSTAAAMAVIAEPLPTTPSMDLALQQRANEEDLEIVFLEEAEFQLELLSRYVTTEVLLELLEDYETIAELSERGLEAYRAGDGDKMAEFLVDPAGWEQTPEGAREALLDDRNEDWLPKIESLLEEGTPFVAVGAGHLVGDESVVELLENEGYELRRLEAE